MAKVSFTVICAFNPDHKFPVVYDITNESEDIQDSKQEFCPYCGKLVNVTVKGELEAVSTVHRRLGFKHDESS